MEFERSDYVIFGIIILIALYFMFQIIRVWI